MIWVLYSLVWLMIGVVVSAIAFRNIYFYDGSDRSMAAIVAILWPLALVVFALIGLGKLVEYMSVRLHDYVKHKTV